MKTSLVEQANRTLFARYLDIIENAEMDALSANPRLSLENLAWMCRQGGKEGMPLDKASRWLGFVQGCLAMRGLIDVDHERDVSRPLYHHAYGEPVSSLSRD